MPTNDRTIELETRLMHLDDTIDQLNTIVSKQQLTIDKLERILTKIVKEHNDMKEQMAPEIIDSKPPHY